MQLFLRYCGRFSTLHRRVRASNKWFFAYFLRLSCIVRFIRSCLLPSVITRRQQKQHQAVRVITSSCRQFLASVGLSARADAHPLSDTNERLAMISSDIQSLHTARVASVVRLVELQLEMNASVKDRVSLTSSLHEAQTRNKCLEDENVRYKLELNDTKRRLVVVDDTVADLQRTLNLQQDRLEDLERQRLLEFQRHQDEREVLMSKLQEAVASRSQAEHEVLRMSLERDKLLRLVQHSRTKENFEISGDRSNPADPKLKSSDPEAEDAAPTARSKYLDWLKSHTPSKSRKN
jgi:chromosome segregation ATPase